MINKKRLIGLTQKLIRINSENPPGDEKKIGNFVRGYLSDLGLKTRMVEFKKGRSNVLAFLKGRGGRGSLLFTPHLDTVCAGKSWKHDSFAGEVIGDKIYGLGATDCKGNLACAMEALSSLVEDKKTPQQDLIFAATADEECGSNLGLIPLLDKGVIKPDYALVLDSDEFDIIVTQKGMIHLKVKIQGKRSHGAYPWRGENAIECAVNIIKELKGQKGAYPRNKYLRPPTINVGTIRGGDKVNIVADWCEFELDFRFLPGQKAEKILQNLKKVIKKYTNKFVIEVNDIQEPYYIPESHVLVRALKKAMLSCNIKSRMKGSEGATVITFFQHKNIPAVSAGFGSAGCAHASDEYVLISNLYKGARVLEEFLWKGLNS
ncbi:MAG: ArgE/DapE family deacylase [Candidatus Omnitrophica bacterium]|nr:ArgE/DapE family deacylase [Candidatus Omnitrophota bacterium]